MTKKPNRTNLVKIAKVNGFKPETFGQNEWEARIDLWNKELKQASEGSKTLVLIRARDDFARIVTTGKIFPDDESIYESKKEVKDDQGTSLETKQTHQNSQLSDEEVIRLIIEAERKYDLANNALRRQKVLKFDRTKINMLKENIDRYFHTSALTLDFRRRAILADINISTKISLPEIIKPVLEGQTTLEAVFQNWARKNTKIITNRQTTTANTSPQISESDAVDKIAEILGIDPFRILNNNLIEEIMKSGINQAELIISSKLCDIQSKIISEAKKIGKVVNSDSEKFLDTTRLLLSLDIPDKKTFSDLVTREITEKRL